MSKYYFSPSTKGFYISGLHAVMPTDVVAMSDDEYMQTISTLAQGKVLTVTNNKATTTDTTLPVATWDSIRKTRDNLLTACDWTQIADAALTADQKTAWATYRQQLRDITKTYASPDKLVWPSQPA